MPASNSPFFSKRSHGAKVILATGRHDYRHTNSSSNRGVVQAGVDNLTSDGLPDNFPGDRHRKADERLWRLSCMGLDLRWNYFVRFADRDHVVGYVAATALRRRFPFPHVTARGWDPYRHLATWLNHMGWIKKERRWSKPIRRRTCLAFLRTKALDPLSPNCCTNFSNGAEI